MDNTIEIKIPAIETNKEFCSNVVASFVAETLNICEEKKNDIKTATCEAVSNVVSHAYDNGEGLICITVKIKDNKTVIIKVKDAGKGIENISQAKQPMFTTAMDDSHAGLGFNVMECFSDNVKVVSKVGKGTTVTLKYNIV